MDRHVHLNRILAAIKNNPESKTFKEICRDYINDGISVELMKEYEEELKENRFIRINDEKGQFSNFYILTVNGQRFVNEGGYSRHENSWFLKTNYQYLKWVLGTLLVSLIALAAWRLTSL